MQPADRPEGAEFTCAEEPRSRVAKGRGESARLGGRYPRASQPEGSPGVVGVTGWVGRVRREWEEVWRARG